MHSFDVAMFVIVKLNSVDANILNNNKMQGHAHSLRPNLNVIWSYSCFTDFFFTLNLGKHQSMCIRVNGALQENNEKIPRECQNQRSQSSSEFKRSKGRVNQNAKLSQLMRSWYLSHTCRLPAKTQASLRIRAVSPEPSLFAHMTYWSRWRVRPNIRRAAPLDDCACAFEEWVYGGRKVP